MFKETFFFPFIYRKDFIILAYVNLAVFLTHPSRSDALSLFSSTVAGALGFFSIFWYLSLKINKHKLTSTHPCMARKVALIRSW